MPTIFTVLDSFLFSGKNELYSLYMINIQAVLMKNVLNRPYQMDYATASS